MTAIDGYKLVRSDRDQHVMTSEHSSSYKLRDLVRDTASHAELARLTKILTPSVSIMNVYTDDKSLPSHRLIDSFDPLSIAQLSKSFKLSPIEAVGKIIRDGTDPSSSANFLSAVPPAHIHAMQRGPYWIGDLYIADMIVSTLKSLSVDIEASEHFLDLGCSSGSLLRALAWAFPHAKFSGCDPVAPSIEWAQTFLVKDNLRFFHQKQVPPLDLEDESQDYVSAISIFSHHGMSATKAWFDEVHRVLKPNGIFIFTTHGGGSILRYTEGKLKPLERYQEIYSAYLSTGYAFEEVWLSFDESGNIATATEWGNSFFDIRVVAGLMHRQFDILFCGLRMNQFNQDFYVVRKAVEQPNLQSQAAPRSFNVDRGVSGSATTARPATAYRGASVLGLLGRQVGLAIREGFGVLRRG